MQGARAVVSTPAGQIVHHRVYLPANAEPKYRDPDRLWTAVESAERRRDAVLARRLDVTLPRELPIKALVEIIDRIAERFLSFGVPLQADLHVTASSDGGKNPHAHFLIAERQLFEEEFQKKSATT